MCIRDRNVLDRYDFNEDIPEWNDEGTMNKEERGLITQSMKEVNQIMEAYVGIVRSNTRLIRAWNLSLIHISVFRTDVTSQHLQTTFSGSVCRNGFTT